MSRFIEHEGAGLHIDLYHCGLKGNTYDVRLEYGVWPTDGELVNLCDGADAYAEEYEQRHGGGEVIGGEDGTHRIVKVYKEEKSNL